MKATVLVDNVATNVGKGEWGLSIYIEYGNMCILLDAGASCLFAQNAKRMGLDLSRVDVAVLSHAHFDHANGLEDFIEKNDHAPIYIQQQTSDNCYKRIFGV